MTNFEATPRLYKELADELLREINDLNYVSSIIEFEFDEHLIIFTFTVMVYRNELGQITDIVPIWWECDTYNQYSDRCWNNVSFSELKKYAIK